MAERSDDVKELRLALVCYGGVSLAIYMHGITKEIFKLVRASRALDADLALPTPPVDAKPTQPAPDWDTEHVYYAALRALADAGKPLSVTVDIVGGTSAGGINGVCLARGLARSRSLDGFRDLWIDEGSIVNLVERSPAQLGAMLVHYPLEVLKHTVGRRIHEPGLTGAPLNGNKMSQMLCAAFDGMASLPAPGPATLLPDGGSIELLVTTTDLEGYDVLVDTGAGGVSNSDKAYRQVLRFAASDTGADDADDFEGDGAVAALTFAARVTSSFPGAFPPVSLTTFQDSVRASDRRLLFDATDITRHFIYDTAYGAKPDQAWYVDGGVLDNAPFDHVVDAIATKRAELETSRHLIYIQPDPGHAPVASEGAPLVPTWFTTVRESIATIPKHKPILDALEGLREMNERIAEIGKLAELQSDEVIAALPGTSTLGMSYEDSVEAAGEVREAAVKAAGQTFGSYCRLRADTAARTFGDGLCARLGYPPDSNEAAFVVGVLAAWVQSTSAWLHPSFVALETELTQADVSLRERRARFVANGINALLTPADPAGWSPPRADLVAMKAASWDLVDRLATIQATTLSAVTDGAMRILGSTVLTCETVASDPRAFVASHGAELAELFASYKAELSAAMQGSSRDLWVTLLARTSEWGAEGANARAHLLSRYLAFPIWDVLIFPVIALSGLPQLSQIHVTRFSPLDATALVPLDGDGRAERAGHKLKGRVLHHFGGFFDKEWRENDYLWGRLDGAELILKLLGQESAVALPDSLRDQGFRAVLEAERTGLKAVDGVIAALLNSLPAAD
jgi:patatin-related protein